jgi:hypothetical protein
MQRILAQINSTWLTLAATAVALLLVSGVVLAAPVEATLGTGIRSVYVHVGFTWVGMAGLYLAGAAGMVALFWPQPTLLRWMRAVGMVGLIFFAAGTAVSLYAQQVNWGSISWVEPITAAMLRFTAVGIIVHILLSWPINARLQGGLSLALALFHVWSVDNTPLVLHPQDPIGTSTSSGIRDTFSVVAVISAALAVWLILYIYNRIVQSSVQDADQGVDQNAG